MNLWLRLLLLIVSFAFRPRIAPPDGFASLGYRVLPTDLDLNLHMTNSRYACFADLSRLDLFVRSGMIQTAFRRDWRPMMLASKIRFRRELKPFRRFRVETRIRWWSGTSIVYEHRFVTRGRDGAEILAAIALERGGFYARKEKAFVAVDDLFVAMGLPKSEPPAASAEIVAFMQAEEEMRRAA
jgi:acyl-CoA thioesterase FadM